jgi:O-antigen/teichoic acid export membrane protein
MPLVQRLLAGCFAVLFLIAVLVFASIALGVLVALALAAWVWLWWRSRSLPRPHTIEGEYRDVTSLERLEERRGERL